ncbi:GNAT family N-acetyltransferase [Leptotrichia sp. oral taxon 221]|uniref:GNAT family N-acetyltransferase n=1 Tax=Leptotrichia sp. oral taxon 221 TaxID=712362 RepID=UPI001B8BE92C|nr:GNAT family N-acetyltransferase [Leptotrichia sp. oral taxon 221]QUB96534.1 GNAT family N-acetyltransferase [Leptotrichia sp. oral taxon 221]
MKIINWNDTKKERKDLLFLKGIDNYFNFNEDDEELFFLYKSEKIIGYAVLIKENEVSMELKRIFIVSKLRNNACGTILLKFIINWLINNDYDSLVVKNHKKMNNFLEKQRFVKTENGYELNNLRENRKEYENMMFVSKFAIVVNVVLALLKIISGNIFQSVSLLSDGLNSLSDLITNILVIVGLKVGNNPEDSEHPFGHGKIESVFSVIIGTFIIISAFEVIQENFLKLFEKNSGVLLNKWPIIITIMTIIIKIFQLIFMKQKTGKEKSALIETLLVDYKMDIVISSSVLVGLLLSLISPLFDIIVGLIIAIYIIINGYQLISENALILLDSQDKELLEEIREDILKFPEIENAHDFRMTTSGKEVYIFVDVRMNRDKTIEEAHEIVNEITKTLKYKYKNVKRILIHVEPMYSYED